ncbi:MAG: hypothetical protein R6W97_07995 [Thiobacillus sp.]
MDTIDNPTPAKAPGMNANRKIMLGLAGALVVVALGMYMWKGAAVSAVEAKLTQLQAEQALTRADLIEQARQLDATRTEAALKRFSSPFAWSIRRELMASNLDQVDQYFTELVQMEGFESVILSTPDDKVVVASDRKQLGQAFSSLYAAQYLQAKEITIERLSSGGLRAIIPIMGLNQNLGTVVLDYTALAFPLQ